MHDAGARLWDGWEAHPDPLGHVYFTGLKIHIFDRYADYSAFIFIWYGYAAGAGPSRPRIDVQLERCSFVRFVHV